MSSVLQNEIVQQQLNDLKNLLVQTETAKRRPGWAYRERYQGESKLSGPTYRDIPVYDYDESQFHDVEYRRAVKKAWENAKEAVKTAFQELPDAPKNWQVYYNDMEAPSPGEWLYNVESFIESAEEKTEEGKGYAKLQKAKAKAKDWISQADIVKNNPKLKESLLDYVDKLETEQLKQWIRYIKSNKSKTSEDIKNYAEQLIAFQKQLSARKALDTIKTAQDSISKLQK